MSKKKYFCAWPLPSQFFLKYNTVIHTYRYLKKKDILCYNNFKGTPFGFLLISIHRNQTIFDPQNTNFTEKFS